MGLRLRPHLLPLNRLLLLPNVLLLLHRLLHLVPYLLLLLLLPGLCRLPSGLLRRRRQPRLAVHLTHSASSRVLPLQRCAEGPGLWQGADVQQVANTRPQVVHHALEVAEPAKQDESAWRPAGTGKGGTSGWGLHPPAQPHQAEDFGAGQHASS